MVLVVVVVLLLLLVLVLVLVLVVLVRVLVQVLRSIVTLFRAARNTFWLLTKGVECGRVAQWSGRSPVCCGAWRFLVGLGRG